MLDLTEFSGIQAQLLAKVPRSHSRFLKNTINWESRLFGIVGGRGCGKTTLLLQHLAEKSDEVQNYLYVSADHIRAQAMGLYEIASYFFRYGGKCIVIDEIHKYKNWAQEVKNLYDAFPEARIAFSGSSTLALQTGKADLSRRAIFYSLPGLSFREYLSLAHEYEFSPISLKDLMENHQMIASEILKKGAILGHFRDYLDHGIYPFFLEGVDEYYPRILNILEKVLYEDIPSTIGVKATSVPSLKRMLWLIATSQPFAPNIDRMSRDLKISKEYIYTYIDALERAGLFSGILPSKAGYRLVRKPAKIYMENTNLLKAVAGDIGGKDLIGAVRETFFVHQARSAGLHIRFPGKADFLIEDRYIVEIGGRGKKKNQINTSKNSFLIKDDIEAGFGNIIPLWLFGFLY